MLLLQKKRKRKKKERKKEKRNLSKNANMTQKHVTAVKRWSPLSFYCSALPDLSLVLFPGMSVSQPFPKGSGDVSVSSLVRMVDRLVDLYLISHTPWLSMFKPNPNIFRKYKKHAMSKSISSSINSFFMQLCQCCSSAVQSWYEISVDSIPVSLLKPRKLS